MEVIMKVNSDKTKFVVQDFTHGLVVKNMKGYGKITKCMAMVLYCGKTKENIKEIL